MASWAMCVTKISTELVLILRMMRATSSPSSLSMRMSMNTMSKFSVLRMKSSGALNTRNM